MKIFIFALEFYSGITNGNFEIYRKLIDLKIILCSEVTKARKEKCHGSLSYVYSRCYWLYVYGYMYIGNVFICGFVSTNWP